MANHMKEVANMLGVELGERFGIGDTKQLYYFDKYGLHCEATGDWLCGLYMNHLLSGEYTIKRIPWKPTYNEKYYSVGPGGTLEPGCWMNDFLDCMLYKLGNCYRTAADAAYNTDKWITFYSSDNIVEV